MMQMSIREGIKKFADKDNNTLLKEPNLLHNKQALRPRMKDEMSYKERKRPYDSLCS